MAALAGVALLSSGIAPALAADTGSVKGKVTYKGGREALPDDLKRKGIPTTAADPNCTKQIGTNTVHVQKAADGSGISFVLVSIKADFAGKTFETPAEPAVLNQEGCEYKPHVLALMVNQKLEIHNNDDTSHNIHTLSKDNPEINISQPKKGAVDTKTFTKPEVFFTKCDVHPWMGAWIGVFAHPYFAVTNEKGEFEIKNLPPGEYTLQFWHPNEAFGTQTQTIKVEAAAVEANLEWEKK
jgi:plastocyanin